MWNYEKRLQYPVNIKTPNGKIAQIIMSQYGGPDGEIGASMRYLSQRFSMPNRKIMGVLNDIGTEELAHLEMVSTIVHQLTRSLSVEEIEKAGLAPAVGRGRAALLLPLCIDRISPAPEVHLLERNHGCRGIPGNVPVCERGLGRK